MDTFAYIMLGALSLAIAGLLAWGVFGGMRTALREDRPLPFFGMLEGRGLTLAQAEEVVGIGELARATRRCALCAAKSDCGRRSAFCPNQSLLLRAKLLAGGRS